jgi:propionate CoA-transferase
VLIEVAPGIDVERDVVAKMAFRPAVASTLRTMDARLFRPDKLGLARDLAANTPRPRSERLALLST